MSEQPIPGTGPSRLREASCGGPPRGSLFGLAPDGVFRAASLALRAVRSYRTFSPLPAPHRSGAQAVCSLWHFPSESVSAVPPACISGQTGVTRHRALMVFGLSSLRLREERFSALPKSRARYAGGKRVARCVKASMKMRPATLACFPFVCPHSFAPAADGTEGKQMRPNE